MLRMPNLVGRGGVLVDVQLADRDLGGMLGGYLLDDGADGAAGTAPGSPEVDDHRLRGAADLGVESVVGQGLDLVAHVSSSLQGIRPGDQSPGCWDRYG